MPKLHRAYVQDFTMVHNEVLRDGRLSYKAKGLFMYLWHLPDDCEISLGMLQAHSQEDGQRAVRTGVTELESKGYLTIARVRAPQTGKFTDTAWTLDDSPSLHFAHVDNPKLDNPKLDNPSLDNVITSYKYSEEESTPEIRTKKNPSVSPNGETSPQRDAPKTSSRVVLKPKSRRCPLAYTPDAVYEWGRTHFPDVDVDAALEAMRDWEFKDAKSDWDATLRNWIRSEAKRAPRASRSTAPHGLTEREYRTMKNAQELIEETPTHDQRRPSAFLSGPGSNGRDV